MSRGWKKYHYSHNSFGEKMREYRSAVGWSFGDLSRHTGINKGTLQQAEEKERSLTESDRMKIIDVLLEASEKANIRTDRREFLKLAGLGISTSLEAAGGAGRGALEHNPSSMLTRYSRLCLELAESRIADLRSELYKGKASDVRKEAHLWYRKLIDAGLPETDPYIASIQVRFGILLGQAQEATLPWYQRCKASVQTYNDVEERVIFRFPLLRFQTDYARLLALRAPMYRELGQFSESILQFKDGLSYAERIDNPFLKSALLRDGAHLRAVQGNEAEWSRFIEEALNHANRVGGAEGKQLYDLVKDTQGNGYKRLAYNPRMCLSEDVRRKYAYLALDCLKEAYPDSIDRWFTNTSTVVVDGHPLIADLSIAQCFVWIDPYEALNLLEHLRLKATHTLPSLLAKIDYASSCAKKRLAWHKGDPLPVLNLDAKYVRSQ